MPLVSIILPYYRKINYVKKTINSILGQSFKDFEIILIYDDEDLQDLSVIENDFKNNPKIKQKLKFLFSNKSQIIESLSSNYRDSFEKKNINKYKKTYNKNNRIMY